MPRRFYAACTAIALTGLLAACHAADSPVGDSFGVVITPSVPSLALAAGTAGQASVTASSSADVTLGSVTWGSSDPKIAAIDSAIVGPKQSTVYVRAVAAGQAALTYTAVSSAQTVAGTIPITVR